MKKFIYIYIYYIYNFLYIYIYLAVHQLQTYKNNLACA